MNTVGVDTPRGQLSVADEGGQLSLSGPETPGNVALAADDGEAEVCRKT